MSNQFLSQVFLFQEWIKDILRIFLFQTDCHQAFYRSKAYAFALILISNTELHQRDHQNDHDVHELKEF